MSQRPSEHPVVVALGAARERLETARAYGHTGGLFNPWRASADYREALRECPLTADDLAAASTDLERRLEAGLAAKERPGISEHFLTLLRRYEVIKDIQHPEEACWRLARYEAAIAQAGVA